MTVLLLFLEVEVLRMQSRESISGRKEWMEKCLLYCAEFEKRISY